MHTLEGQPRGRGEAIRPARRRRSVLLVAAWSLLAALAFAAAWREARQFPVQSDGASIALQAWQMLHGNLLLRGWHVADVSFYTTDIPVYMAVEAVRGLRFDVVAISVSINYTLILVCVALIAKGHATGREGAVRALLAAGVMLAPTLAAGSWLLNDADHAATVLWVLLALLVIDRGGRRWHVPVVVTAILAWAIVGDPLVEVIGAVPLVLVGVVRAYPGLFRVTGQERMARLRGQWFELSLAAAGAASFALGAAATRAIGAVGGWVSRPVRDQLVRAAKLPANLAVESREFLALFSADFLGRHGPGLIAAIIHLAGAAVVVLALVAAIWHFARRGDKGGDLIADFLLVAIAGNLGAYLLLYPAMPDTIREVSPVFALGAALAGRALGGALARRRLEPVLAVGIACYLLTMGPALTGQARPPHNLALTGWLEGHHLYNGLAGYWQTNSVTFDSGTRVIMRPVKGGKGGRPVVRLWETDMNQVNPAANSADFLVLRNGRLAAKPPITESGVVRAFGKPVETYHYRGYTIMVWHKNLLRLL